MCQHAKLKMAEGRRLKREVPADFRQNLKQHFPLTVIILLDNSLFGLKLTHHKLPAACFYFIIIIIIRVEGAGNQRATYAKGWLACSF